MFFSLHSNNHVSKMEAINFKFNFVIKSKTLVPFHPQADFGVTYFFKFTEF